MVEADQRLVTEAAQSVALGAKADKTHTHSTSQVTGLDAALAALTYRSGRRNITALLDPAPVSGALYIERRGDTVWLQFDALVPSDSVLASVIYSGALPSGFQPIAPAELSLAPRLPDDATETYGNLRIYNSSVVLYRVPANGTVRGLVSWPTNQDTPTVLPGTPA